MSRILIVGDDCIVQHFLCRMLEVMGYICEIAQYGGEALARLKMSSPNLIITDHKMPVMNGLEFLEEVSGNPELKSIPVILLTGSNLKSIQDRAQKLVAFCSLSKPLDFQTMRASVVLALS